MSSQTEQMEQAVVMASQDGRWWDWHVSVALEVMAEDGWQEGPMPPLVEYLGADTPTDIADARILYESIDPVEVWMAQIATEVALLGKRTEVQLAQRAVIRLVEEECVVVGNRVAVTQMTVVAEKAYAPSSSTRRLLAAIMAEVGVDDADVYEVDDGDEEDCE